VKISITLRMRHQTAAAESLTCCHSEERNWKVRNNRCRRVRRAYFPTGRRDSICGRRYIGGFIREFTINKFLRMSGFPIMCRPIWNVMCGHWSTSEIWNGSSAFSCLRQGVHPSLQRNPCLRRGGVSWQKRNIGPALVFGVAAAGFIDRIYV